MFYIIGVSPEGYRVRLFFAKTWSRVCKTKAEAKAEVAEIYIKELAVQASELVD
jgi:hypothetical protein